MLNCPRIEVKEMEDEFYNLTVKGNDLKTYVRRFQDLVVLCPTMVPNSEKLMEFFIGGLPRSIEGNVTASKPQTLEEAITITQRLMDQVIKHNSVQGTNDNKQKFDDRRTFTNNNNYQNNRNNNSNHNNDHQQQQNRRQETVRAYAVTPTENSRRERALQKSVLKSKQQCPRKSILAERQERSPRPERSHGRRRKQVANIVELEIQTIVAPMAERIMEELLRAPTEGYGEAIVLTRTKSCDHFEIKTNLLSVVQANAI
ncbi:hypothetical protein Tco_0791938 [Tanacetum coccineum]